MSSPDHHSTGARGVIREDPSAYARISTITDNAEIARVWGLDPDSRRFPGRPLTTRQYARLDSGSVARIGLDASFYGTHSLRRTKATLIYSRTGNLRAVQLLLGHQTIASTVRYLGIEVDDALAIAEQVDV